MSIYNVFLGYGGKKLIKLVISADTNNYNVLSAAQSSGQGYAAGRSSVELTVNPGVVVGSTAVANPAMTVSGFTNGDSVKIINNGTIIGTGGNGGATGYNRSDYGNGTAGGNALQVGYGVSIDNNGIISGGGGGGGGAPGYHYNSQTCWGGPVDNWTPQGGGGGGAGRTVGSGGSGSSGGSSGTLYIGGAAGTNNAGPYANSRGGSAGKGGNAGVKGDDATGSGGVGGQPGNYVQGSSLVTWINTGDRRGGSA